MENKTAQMVKYEHEVNFNKAFFLILFYVVVFPAIAAYYCWQKGVEIIGPNRASMFIQLTKNCDNESSSKLQQISLIHFT